MAASMCGLGACEIAGCEPGFADCNRMAADGCEVPTTGPMNCGTCGTPCTIANGTPDCSSGACRVGTCNPGFGDCNGMAADGCEQPLTTLAHCGACGNTCDLPRASESCTTGMCRIASCDPGFGDCDLNAASGCETSTRTNADCGTCGTACSPLHATGDCSTGTCEVASCDPGFGDCNFDSLSCESGLNTNTNCGMCGRACMLANANESCSSGSCTLTSCLTNFSNCDMDATNGCEVSHRAVAGACGSNFVGSYESDTLCGVCGFSCCGNPLETSPFATRTGTTSGFFHARMLEDSSCDADFNHQVTLQSPSGANYDLYLYRPCSTVVDSSSAGAGGLDTVDITVDDPFTGGTEMIDYYVEVRHVSGSSCSPWTLRFFGRNCE